MKKLFSALLFAVLVSVVLSAADIYVSKETGKNSNAGTKDAPLKNLQKALDKAKDGDKIYVAQGNYSGIRDIGFLEVKTAVEIYGGYSKDFSNRDILKYRTTVIPSNEASKTSSSKPLLGILHTGRKTGLTVIDGLIFDKGEANNYHGSDGKPKGVSTGYLTIPPQKGTKPNITPDTPLIKGVAGGICIIQNCVFNNSPHFAIQVGIEAGGKMKILNNVFTSSVMGAIEVWGRGRGNDSELEVAYNTILFTWTRTRYFEDMGYAVRFKTRCHTDIHHNVIGCAYMGAISKTNIDAPKSLEESRISKMDHNRFFLNKFADLVLPSGGGMFENVRAADFEDLEMTSAEGNEELKDVGGLKNALNKAYLEGFLSISFSESTDFDPNSPVNQFRAAMGMNQVGKISTKVSMFGNQYPLEDSLKLFGAVKGFGAQIVK